VSRPRPAYLLLTVAVATVLTSCAGVPRSSAPQVVQPVPLGAPRQPAIHPFPGEAARDIVKNFLAANAVDPAQHASARRFLTEAAANRWSDTTATIIDDETIGTYRPSKPQVVVSGREVGTLNSNGTYSPSRQGSGNGGPHVSFVYGVRRVHGDYRIDSPWKGLLLTVDQFQEAYRRRALYFFDLSNRYLVPDPRWTALTGPSLAEWLVSELAAGPSPELQNAVSGDSVPQQAVAQQRFVRSGSPMKVEITGSSQLGAAARDRLAAQIGTTLNDAMPGQIFQITDGGVPVPIPAANSTQFDAAAFSEDLGPPAPSPIVYYLHDGEVVNSQGAPLLGLVNDRKLGYLSSVAVSRPSKTSQLTFAATAGGRLLLGTMSGGLVKTRIHGDLTRPVFAPGLDEVWVGDGDKLYRIDGVATVAARQPRIHAVTIPQLASGQRIVAAVFSPEGSRVALILGSPGGSDQLYVGAVIRTAGQVSIDLPSPPISPQGVSVTDVAWLEPLSLFAIGDLTGNKEPRIFNTNVDGSFWSDSSIGNLPPKPDSVTVVTGHVVWVSANGTVWYQSGGQNWASPSVTGETFGYAPIYLQ
jgi:hypothetical protein